MLHACHIHRLIHSPQRWTFITINVGLAQARPNDTCNNMIIIVISVYRF